MEETVCHFRFVVDNQENSLPNYKIEIIAQDTENTYIVLPYHYLPLDGIHIPKETHMRHRPP